MDRNRLQRIAPWIGILAVFVTIGSMGAAIALSPSFGPTEHALSNLGVTDHPAGTSTTALVFNGGLILGGLLGATFALAIGVLLTNPITRLGTVLFALSMLLMGAVGVFPQDQPYHFEVAAGFYMVFSVAALVYAVGQFLTEKVNVAALSAGAGLGNLAVWIGWGATGAIARPGLAIPELLGAALIVLWVLAVARTLPTSSSSQSPQPFAWEQ